MNYTMQEYANDIVFAPAGDLRRGTACRIPTIVTESGRAVVAHHSVLVVDVLGVGEFAVGTGCPRSCPTSAAAVGAEPLRDLPRGRRARTCSRPTTTRSSTRTRPAACSTSGTCRWSTRGARRGPLLGDLPEDPQDRRASCARCPRSSRAWSARSSDTYFCNFSMFQSLPDTWAIDQLFPIMPIHRLDEEPTRAAVLADITCDSDGKIDHFIDRRDVKDVLELHPLNRTSPTTWASSWSAPTRRSWATCTTCSATPTPCTCRSTRRRRGATRSSSGHRRHRHRRAQVRQLLPRRPGGAGAPPPSRRCAPSA